jgi:cation diffusion facilitator CzcD-associated flavoprotein CzcO
MANAADQLDVAIVGGGICGVIALHYARKAGLRAEVFERQAGVGGLWRQLPAWQDIQIGTNDWALGELGVAGPYQPDILRNIEAWVDRFGLSDGIHLDTPVLSARHSEGAWRLTLPDGRVSARHLIAATGGHNRPRMPQVRRTQSTVTEFHSSALRDAAALTGRHVLVVGGGASAFDLLDLCFERRAETVSWAHRNVRWMTPARKPKHIVGSVREYGRIQMSGATPEQINAGIQQDLLGRYEKFGLQAIQPREPVDVGRHQLVPGRPLMVQNFGAIRRYEAGVEAIEGGDVILSDGRRLQPDLLLWGTGYEVDLSWFDSPAISSIRDVETLRSRCGGVFVSLDEPDLYFPAVGLDGIGTAPWSYALALRTSPMLSCALHLPLPSRDRPDCLLADGDGQHRRQCARSCWRPQG